MVKIAYFFLVTTACVSLIKASRASDCGRRRIASIALWKQCETAYVQKKDVDTK